MLLLRPPVNRLMTYLRTQNRGLKLFYLTQGSTKQRSATWSFDTLKDGAVHELALAVTAATVSLAVDSIVVQTFALEGPLDECGEPGSSGGGCVTFLGQRAGGFEMTGCLIAADLLRTV